MEKLINYLVANIVSKPENIELKQEINNQLTVYKLKVDPEDLPRVIGKRGRIIKALRQLIRVKSLLSNQKAILVLEED